LAKTELGLWTNWPAPNPSFLSVIAWVWGVTALPVDNNFVLWEKSILHECKSHTLMNPSGTVNKITSAINEAVDQRVNIAYSNTELFRVTTALQTAT
jgi:hypothetical protein